MGTPDFAVPSLKILVDNGYKVVAVVTAPDRPKGRGKKLGTSPVKDYALAQGLPILQPTNLKSAAFIEELKSYNANLQIIVAFRMLPEVVWSMPSIGSFNLHGSLLPQYRGAAPINWAIINGEKETGVTTFFLKHEIDTGNIIFQEKEPINDDDDMGTMYYRLMERGAQLVLKTVAAIASNSYTLTPQEELPTTQHAPKIFKETCAINWQQNAVDVRNFIRGLSPYPAAWTTIENKTFKIFKASFVEDLNLSPGQYQSDGKNYLYIGCKEGTLSVESLQMEGKKRMEIKDLLRGYQIKAGTIAPKI